VGAQGTHAQRWLVCSNGRRRKSQAGSKKGTTRVRKAKPHKTTVIVLIHRMSILLAAQTSWGSAEKTKNACAHFVMLPPQQTSRNRAKRPRTSDSLTHDDGQ